MGFGFSFGGGGVSGCFVCFFFLQKMFPHFVFSGAGATFVGGNGLFFLLFILRPPSPLSSILPPSLSHALSLSTLPRTI